MAPPKVVETWTDMNWVSIDDQLWLSGNVLTDGTPDQVRGAHNDPATGLQCRNTPARLSDHTIVSRDPLHLEPSLACDACTWHGWVRDGHWVPA